jgi:orotidine-5'-phosphate decarboxylase
MTRAQLVDLIFQRRSYLCVGLDTDPSKLPEHLRSKPDAIFEFNKQLIEATLPYCVSYKINTAFYEAMGAKGWELLERTVASIPKTHFRIADAKRGDIGNTSSQYAKAFFEQMDFDAVTVAPYMGEDSIKPFLEFDNKWAIVLALTSNNSAKDFEMLKVSSGAGEAEYLYEKVIRQASLWTTPDRMMFVVGATRREQFANIRKISPHHFYLVPGVGAQGGDLGEISKQCLIGDGGLLVNVSRAIIYASSGEDFTVEAARMAKAYQQEMECYLPAAGV